MFSRNSLRNSLRRSKFYCVEHSNSSTELFHYLLMLFWFHAQSVWVIDQTICMLNPQLVRLQQKEFAWPNKGFKQPICNRPQRLTHNTLTPQYPKHKSSTEILSFIILLWKLNKGLSLSNRVDEVWFMSQVLANISGGENVHSKFCILHFASLLFFLKLSKRVYFVWWPSKWDVSFGEV